MKIENGYKIGKKSNYFGREQELINMWKKRKMTIQAIANVTGVSQRTLGKLLFPLGYKDNPGKPLAPKPLIASSVKAAAYIQQKDYNFEELNSIRRKKQIAKFMKKEAKRAHVRVPTFRKALYEKYPGLKPKEKADLSLTKDQLKELKRLPLEGRDAKLDRMAAEKHYNSEYFRNQILNKYPQLAKKIGKVLLTDGQKAEVKHLYLNKTLTVHEIAFSLRKKGVHVQDRNVKQILVEENVYGQNHQERQQRDYGRRRAKISRANSTSPRAAQARKDRLAAIASVPRTYLGQCTDWAWKLIEEQPALTIVDKLHAFTADRQTIIAFMKAAEVNVGHKITYTEINNYLPTIPGLGSWNRKIADRFGNDPELAEVKGYKSSSYEQKVEAVLRECAIKYTRYERTKIRPYELDFYLPAKRIAIEVSPITTHNSNTYHNYGFPGENGKSSNYHETKMQLCRKQGIILITLFENSLVEPVWSTVTKPFLMHRIAGKLARKIDEHQIEIKFIEKTIAKRFIDTWSAEGNLPCRYAVGVLDKTNNQVIGVTTFGVPHNAEYRNQNLLELRRNAWRSDIYIRNAIPEVISYAHRQLGEQFTGVVAYSSNNIGQGEEYRNSGFTFINELDPKLIFYNPQHPRDCYSSEVATRRSAMKGTIARRLHPMDVSAKEATRIVEKELPWRIGKGHGYVSQFDTGSKVWVKKW